MGHMKLETSRWFAGASAVLALLTFVLALQPDPDAMDAVNPVYIPRNHRVEEALDAATDGDLGPLERLVAAVRSPYVERAEHAAYADPAPDGNVGYQTFCGT